MVYRKSDRLKRKLSAKEITKGRKGFLPLVNIAVSLQDTLQKKLTKDSWEQAETWFEIRRLIPIELNEIDNLTSR